MKRSNKYGGRLPEQGFIKSYRTFNRKEVDEIFLNLMEQEGVLVRRRVVAYQAVRLFGEPAWNSK